MSMTKGLTGLRSAVLALGLVAGAGVNVEAAAILKYSTATAIDLRTGITGPNLISFTPASGLEVDLQSDLESVNVGLGKFVVADPAGATANYKDVKFAITFLPQEYDRTTLTNSTPTIITGTINGTVESASKSDLKATFDTTKVDIDLGSVKIPLNLPSEIRIAAFKSADKGETSAGGWTVPTGSEAPVPEPSTIALVLTTIGGLALRQRVSARRTRHAA